MPNIDPTLLDRVLAGEASETETAALDARERTYPSAAGALDGLRRSGVAPDRWDVDAALARVKHGKPQLVDYSSRFRGSRRLLAAGLIAASLVAALVLSRDNIKRALDGETGFSTAGVTARGQRMRVNLVDGTQVVLAPESRLSIADGFAHGARSVVVQGEAYFRVAHDAARPFRLRAGSGIIEVLGTEFTVRAYREDSTVRVVVEGGRVSFAGGRSATRPVTLQRGDVAELDARDSMSVAHAANPADYMEWVSGRLVFDDAPLSDVARRLERWYDVRVVVADSALAARRLSASFRDQPLREVLRSLCGGLRARCVQEGRDVRIDVEAPSR